jgi:hypothetical protein
MRSQGPRGAGSTSARRSPAARSAAAALPPGDVRGKRPWSGRATAARSAAATRKKLARTGRTRRSITSTEPASAPSTTRRGGETSLGERLPDVDEECARLCGSQGSGCESPVRVARAETAKRSRARLRVPSGEMAQRRESQRESHVPTNARGCESQGGGAIVRIEAIAHRLGVMMACSCPSTALAGEGSHGTV